MFIRTANAGDPASFGAGAGPDLPDLTEQTSRMWAAGRSRPQWCFVASDGDGHSDPSGDSGSGRGGVSASGHGRVLARIGLSVVHDPAAPIDSRHPDVELLRRAFGALPLELGVFGLAYPGGAGAAIELLREVLGRLDVAPGTVIEPRSNAETHSDASIRHEINARHPRRHHGSRQTGTSQLYPQVTTPLTNEFVIMKTDPRKRQ